MLIAITGSIASGKSTVRKMIKTNNFRVVDCDEIVHNLFIEDEDVIESILIRFPECANTEVNIDRKILADIIFNDKTAKEDLEAIIHPVVKRKLLELDRNELIFVEIPLLFEAHMEDLFFKIITICSKKKIQIARLTQRSNLTKKDALNRINSQMNIKEKIKRSDYVIYNNGNLEKLKIEIDKLIEEIMKLI